MTASAASGRVAGTRAPGRLAPGDNVGGVTITAPLRVTAMAEVYQADGASGPVTIHIVHAELAAVPTVRDAIVAAARRLATLDEHKHLVRTLGAGAERTPDGQGALLWVMTEALDGNSVRDLLDRKRQVAGGGGGFGARGAGNLVIGVADGLTASGPHGGLSTDSVIVSRTGRVRVCDAALGAGQAAAIAAGVLAAGSHVAPEVARGTAPSAEADVYGLGALLYEALVGRPLERGGPRPSDVVPGLTTTIDEIIARTCASSPDKRFGSVAVVRELVAEALGRGAAVEDDAAAASPAPARPSLSQSIAAAPVGTAAEPVAPSIAAAAVDPALAAALADTTEKWLVAKGRLDYGPFSLQDVVEQIRKGDIVHGNVIIDKDTGARMDVGQHPLLGPMVDAARQALDDARRAQAEVHHQTKEKKRSVLLFATIGAVLAAIGVIVFLVLRGGGGSKDDGGVSGVAKVGGASLDVKMSPPKKPEPKKKPAGGGSRGGSRGGGGGGGGDDDEMLALDLSGDEDATETLDMNTIYGVYSRYGGQLGGCMSRNGSSYVLISIIIDGPSGKVTWVRVNGQKGGGLYDCINRVMRGMKFPAVNGPRSRAEFDISL